MIKSCYPLYIANHAERPNEDLVVTDKYNGQVVTRTAQAGPEEIERAIAACHRAETPMRRLPAFERQAVLAHCAMRLRERREEFAQILCLEAGKPIADSRGEVDRTIDTFSMAAAEAVRLGGEVMDLEISARARGYRGFYRRVPIGACSLISPFNFPLNLVAHKIAPAIAAGCPFVLKPASLTPVSALLLGELLAETALPPGAFSILPCQREHAGAFTSDPRLRLLSFTGSPEVGWQLKAMAGKKKVVLELGGNAACVVEPDWPDLDDAAARITVGAFCQSGQSCISVQRILIHRQIYDELKTRLITRARALMCGDPKDERTAVGPLISEKEAIRLENWIHSARQAGARVLCGGTRCGPVLSATLLEGVPLDHPLSSEEAFGPVAVLAPYDNFTQALDLINASRFGLQAGIFTHDLYKAQQAWDDLEMGGVLIGDIPTWRVEHMPYGGVKDSGLGREGVRFAMEDMTEIRSMVIRTPGAGKQHATVPV